jgi:hypothetical protein
MQDILNLLSDLDWHSILSFIPIAALIGATITVSITVAARKQSRRALAIQLHEFYLSADFNAKVRSPAYHVGLQWVHLPETLRQAYRDAVASGWASEDTETKLLTYVAEIPHKKDEIIPLHFHSARGLPSLTEHQALSACLRFWSRLNTHIKLKTVDKKVLRSLFADEFGYHREFFRSLSEAVMEKKSKTKPCPAWIDDIQELGNFFGVNLEVVENSR